MLMKRIMISVLAGSDRAQKARLSTERSHPTTKAPLWHARPNTIARLQLERPSPKTQTATICGREEMSLWQKTEACTSPDRTTARQGATLKPGLAEAPSTALATFILTPVIASHQPNNPATVGEKAKSTF